MSSKRRKRLCWLAIPALLGAMPRALTAQPVTPAQPASPAPSGTAPTGPIDVEERIKSSLSQDDLLLRNGRTQAERDDAAARLVQARDGEPARIRVREAIRLQGNRGAQLAVARAVSKAIDPDPQLVPALVPLLGVDPDLTSAVAGALAAYKDRAASLDPLLRYVAQPAVAAQEPSRAAAVRALGGISDKRVAQVLVGLLQNDKESRGVRDAAADALRMMTGLDENGRDAGAWGQWWAANQVKDAVGFKAGLVDRARRVPPPPTDLDTIVQDHYRIALPAQKADVLKLYLNANDPVLRAAGIRLVELRARQDGAKPPGAFPRVRELVSDPSPDVRAHAVRLIRAINDRESLEALLVQLRQEPDPGVRAAIQEAIGTIKDARAVPELLNQLNDPVLHVAVSAAEALNKLGPVIAADVGLRGRVVAEVRRAMDGRGRQPGRAELRGACTEALVPLADASLEGMFLTMLRRPADEAPRTRKAAVQALGVIRNPQTGDFIVGVLRGEQDPGVRLAAIEALGPLGNFAYAEALYDLSRPAAQDENAVREAEAAWRVFRSLLPMADKRQLIDWAERRFSRPEDAARRLPVLIALADKQKADNELKNLAATRENIGNAHFQAKAFEQAAPYFRQAMDFWQQNNAGGQVMEGLIGRLMDAHLEAKQFAEAVRLAEEVITATPGQQPLVASRITNYAEALVATNPREALRLVAEAEKIRTPLNAPFPGFLASTRQAAQQKLDGTKPNTP